jgi:Zn-dependent oligopeptidase
MPEKQKSMDEHFREVHALLRELRDESGEMRTSSAITAEKMTQVVEHLKKLNGRTGRTEDRVAQLEMARSEELIVELKAELRAALAAHEDRIKQIEAVGTQVLGGWRLLGGVIFLASTFGTATASVLYWIATQLK